MAACPATPPAPVCRRSRPALHPRARRGGVGRRLVAAVGPAMLTVREGNGEAQAFYARAGFAVVTRWRGYYAGGEAALVLRRGQALAPEGIDTDQDRCDNVNSANGVHSVQSGGWHDHCRRGA